MICAFLDRLQTTDFLMNRLIDKKVSTEGEIKGIKGNQRIIEGMIKNFLPIESLIPKLSL